MRPTVWIVDDSPLQTEMITRALASAYTVEVFGSGETMLEHIAMGQSPDVLILDWRLPGLSGLEVCRFLRANPATLSLPVLLITTYGTKADTIEGFAAGADDYLAKPFEPTELSARVAALLRGRQLRRRAERAEQTLRVLLQHLPDSIIALGARSAITFANAEAERILGRSQEALVGMHIGTVLPELGAFLGAQPPGEPGALPDVLIGDRLFAPVARPLPTDGFTGTVIALRDVTQERTADATVRESEERFRLLAEAIPQIVWTADPRGTVDYFNARWFTFTGHRADRALAEGFWPALHPDDRARVEAQWSHSLASGEPFETECRLRGTGDSAWRWHLGRAMAQRDARGRIRKWFGTWTDITEWKRSERALVFLASVGVALASSLEPEATLQRLTEAVVPDIADWCTVLLVEGEKTNVAAVAHVDARGTELLRGLFERFPLDPAIPFGHAKVLRTGRSSLVDPVPSARLETPAHDAEWRTMLLALDPLSVMTVALRANDRVIGAIIFGTSTSRRRYDATDLGFGEEVASRVGVALENARLYQLAQQERLRVEEANRAKDEFLAMVSHELRTPLNAILGWTRMLRSGQLSAEKHARALETVERNARAQTQLIEDLLDVSRIITGKLRLAVRPLDPRPIVEAAIDSVRPAMAAKEIQVTFSADPVTRPVMGDAERLQQVVWNLLTNGIKFTPRGGRVDVRLTASEGQAEISVTDTGSGIAPEFLPYVFERFRQADVGVTRAHGGLGLGLSIVKHLVELHGGTISAASPGEGRGATFVVRIPVITIPVEYEPVEPLLPSGRLTPDNIPFDRSVRLTGLSVLVVDDEADGRDVVASALEQCDARTFVAADAASALEILQRERPDVLVSDIGMPGEDGYTLIRRVRELAAEAGGSTPAVALTAFARAQDRTAALVAGFQTHVAKPIEPSELVVVVARLAGRLER